VAKIDQAADHQPALGDEKAELQQALVFRDVLIGRYTRIVD
jgi:hypothetical protein